MFDKTLTIEFDEKRIDEIFADLDRCHLPGAAVGIAIGGKPVYRKGFGLASMELPVVLSPTIRMRIYSTTKHFACLAYMLLCEEGKAGIDEPLGTYLPELHPVTHKVTMRQLMGHTSGLRDAHDIRWQFSGMARVISSTELLSLYRDVDDVNFAPGTAWCYNNGGFLMLSVAIERITGQSLEDVLRERIFEPVGMHDTLLRRFDTDFVPNSATMHVTNPGGFDRSYLAGALVGEGGMVSTVDDMLRWLAHMHAPMVGSATTWALMKAPQTLVNGTSTGYGLGLQTGLYRGVETLHHGGGGMGANSQMLKLPAARLDIAIMVNRHDLASLLLANKILDACLPGLDTVKEASDRPVATGVFRSPTTGRVIQLCAAGAGLWVKEGQQAVSIDGCVDIPVEPDDEGVLWPAGVASHLKKGVTLIGDREQPTSIRFNDFGNLDELVAANPAEHTDVEALTGQYRSDTTGTAATISETDDGLRLRTVGRFGSAGFKLECLADGIWRAKSTSSVPWGGILLFDFDNAAFRFSSFLTWGLHFRRCA